MITKYGHSTAPHIVRSSKIRRSFAAQALRISLAIYQRWLDEKNPASNSRPTIMRSKISGFSEVQSKAKFAGKKSKASPFLTACDGCETLLQIKDGG